MADLKYGQLLISKEEMTLRKELSEEVVTIPAGNRVVVGFDGLAHHLRDGCIQPISDSLTVEGFSHTGVVAVIWQYLSLRLPMATMLSDVNAEPRQVTDAIEEALEEIGLYDNGEDDND